MQPRGTFFWWLPLGLLLASSTAAAQGLAGNYVHQTEQGQLELVLQHNEANVTGTMKGVDGSVSQLRGTFDGQKATGTIVTGDATGWFAAGFLEGRLILLIAELDAVTGQPNLDDGWRLDFTPARGAVQPGGANMPDAGRPAPPQSASSSAAVTPLVQEWLQHLRGKKITFMESYYSNDSRGSGGYSNQWEAYLCSDMTFHFQRSGGVSADAGGVGGSRSGQNSFSGQWRIVEHSGQAILQYQRREQAGTEEGESVVLGYRDGTTYFGNDRVFVTNENTMCR